MHHEPGRTELARSAATRISHLLWGYGHPKDPQAVVFLSPVVAQLALTGRNATYAHELAHLLTWRYHSHTLREGLADHLALQLHPGAAVGPRRDSPESNVPAVEAVVELLGSTAPPPDRLLQDPDFRRSYYASSHRLVQHLIRTGGLDKFLALYASPDPEAAFIQLYGQDRRSAVAAALR